MSKKRIIIIAAAGLLSFSVMFVLAWLTTTAPPETQAEANQTTLGGEGTEISLPGLAAATGGAADVYSSKMKKTMTEKQLKGLVHEVREKIQEYNNKLEGLEVQEQRLHISQDTLKKDINKLMDLQIELASMVTNLKSERDNLLKDKVKIVQTEKSNLMSIAATYDKMDPTSASKILTNMSRIPNEAARSASLDDVVKILHYMAERTKAKLLAELATSEPKLAALLCRKLKQIVEEE
ncbi:MAG: hypothetical protein ACYSSO_03285 [Planctomycetota bacterium]